MDVGWPYKHITTSNKADISKELLAYIEATQARMANQDERIESLTEIVINHEKRLEVLAQYLKNTNEGLQLEPKR